MFNSPVLTAITISALIILLLVLFFVGFIFVSKIFRGKSGPQRWHAQNIYSVSYLFIVGFLMLLYIKIDQSINWKFFSIGVVLLVCGSILFGVLQFFGLRFSLWRTKSLRKKVSKWPASSRKRRVERSIESDESYYGVKLYKSEASELETQNFTLDASIILIRPETGKPGKIYETELISRGYNLQVCTELTRVLKLTANLDPDIIIWHFKRESKTGILKILKSLQVQRSEHDRPFIFLLVPTTQDIKRFEGLADRVEQYLISPNDFVDAVEELLQKKRVKKAVA